MASGTAPFTWPVRVYWEDTDAGGIVYYANYLRYFERARTEWLRACGVHQQSLRERTGGIFVVSDVRLKYIASARLDDALEVSTTVTQWGKTSLTMAQTVQRVSGEPALLCTADIRVGWVDAQSRRPVRIPSFVLEALQP